MWPEECVGRRECSPSRGLDDLAPAQHAAVCVYIHDQKGAKGRRPLVEKEGTHQSIHPSIHPSIPPSVHPRSPPSKSTDRHPRPRSLPHLSSAFWKTPPPPPPLSSSSSTTASYSSLDRPPWTLARFIPSSFSVLWAGDRLEDRPARPACRTLLHGQSRPGPMDSS